MSRRCSICSHPRLIEIIMAYFRGIPSLRDLGKRYGVSHASLVRHFKNHRFVGFEYLSAEELTWMVEEGHLAGNEYVEALIRSKSKTNGTIQ